MIIYQIYPRSFMDANGDGVGDIKGITDKLGYVKSLGVDAVWISPFFKSPMKDFGYDVADYRDVDPMFGSLDDFRALLRQAKALDLKVIIDMVLSHTSSEHPWFLESRARNSHKADWYLWADPQPDGSPPNNWMSIFGGGGWEWDAGRRQFYFHTFLVSQPDLNMHHPEVQDQVLSDMRFWLEMGVSGFRLDAANHIFQDRDLRSNPPVADPSAALHPYGYQKHIFDQGRPEAGPFFERIGSLLQEYGGYSLAEVGGDDMLHNMAQYTRPGRLSSAYSFALLTEEATASYVRNVVTTLEATVQAPGRPCYALSNHDKPRVASRWAHGREVDAHARLSFALLSSLRGDICIYQGEELGLPESEVPFERLQDPVGKTFWPKDKGRDGCRTPIAWTGDLHGGFSGAEPWLPVDPAHVERNVAWQEATPGSMLAFARAALSLRQSTPALRDGSLEMLPAPDGLLAYRRSAALGEVVCVFNLGWHATHFEWFGLRDVLLSQHAHVGDSGVHLGVSGFCLFRWR